MPILETRLKLILVVITVLCLAATLGAFPFTLNLKRAVKGKSHVIHVLSLVLFITWTLVPYNYIFDLDTFRLEVKQYAVSVEELNKDGPKCPPFDSLHWSQFACTNSVSVSIILLVIYLNYSKLFRNVHWSLESLYEHRRHARVRLSAYEAELGTENHITKKATLEKKVTFQIPEPRVSKNFLFLNDFHDVHQSIAPCKRQVMTAMVCLVLGTFLLPRPAKHAFPMHIFQYGSLKITSDNLIIATMLFMIFELARIVNLSKIPSIGNCDFRLATSKFIQFYGIFLLLLCAIALLQVNDTLKLYVYKVLISCRNTRKWRTFYEVRIPHENILSAILGENMMRYTNGVLRDDMNQQQTVEVIDKAIGLFTWIFGDCVTVLLFANLVFVPVALALNCAI